MFSARHSQPVTATGSSSRAAARTVCSTAAAPAMSDFMASMPAAGLIEMPPESNVMPLPTSATLTFGARRRVRDLDQPRPAHGALTDADQAAVAAGGERLVVEHGDLEALGARVLDGGLRGVRERGRVEVVRGGVDQVAGAVHGGGDDLGAGDRRQGRAVPRVRGDDLDRARRAPAWPPRRRGTACRSTRRTGRPPRRRPRTRRRRQGARDRRSRCRRARASRRPPRGAGPPG